MIFHRARAASARRRFFPPRWLRADFAALLRQAVTKISLFTSKKDKTPLLGNSFVVYEYSCPGCSEKYIGKTESTLFNRTKQHAWTQKDSAVFKHFDQCDGWGHIKGLLQCDAESVNQMLLQTNTVRDNTKIIGKADNWQVLAFKESLKIKDKRPTLNHGVKAAKDLCLFWSRFDVKQTRKMKPLHFHPCFKLTCIYIKTSPIDGLNAEVQDKKFHLFFLKPGKHDEHFRFNLCALSSRGKSLQHLMTFLILQKDFWLRCMSDFWYAHWLSMLNGTPIKVSAKYDNRYRMQFLIKIIIGRLSVFTKISVYKKSDQPIRPKTWEGSLSKSKKILV